MRGEIHGDFFFPLKNSPSELLFHTAAATEPEHISIQASLTKSHKKDIASFLLEFACLYGLCQSFKCNFSYPLFSTDILKAIAGCADQVLSSLFPTYSFLF